MKNKSLITKIISMALMIPVFIGAFLSVFYFATTIGNSQKELISNRFTLFSDLSVLKNFPDAQPFWLILNNIFLVVTLALCLTFIIVFILQLCKVKSKINLNKLMKILAILILISGVIMCVAGFIGMSVNSFKISTALNTTTYIGVDTGFYLQFFGILAGAVGLFIGTKEKRKK